MGAIELTPASNPPVVHKLPNSRTWVRGSESTLEDKTDSTGGNIMLVAHAAIVAEARSCLAALADRSIRVSAAVEYERALLQLDFIHGDEIPGISPMPAHSRAALFDTAHGAIEELERHGVDLLSVELLLDMLEAAWSRDRR